MDRFIQEDIENDYIKGCLSSYKNIQFEINHLDEILINNPKSKMDIKENNGTIEDIIQRLGLVGELSFKYLLKVKQTQLSPNQLYEDFKNQAIFKKGSIKNLANRGIITEEEKDEIINFQDDNNQPFHNYNYLGLILEKVLTNTNNQFKKYFKYSIQSDYIEKIIESEIESGKITQKKDSTFFKALLFPCIYEIDSEEAMNLDETALSIIEKGKEAGDVFTRLRYFSNNQVNQKNYTIDDINDINYFIGQLVDFTKRIYEQNNDLNINAAKAFSKTIALNSTNELERDQDEIMQIYDKYSKDDVIIFINRLLSEYSIDDLEYIDNLCTQYNITTSSVFEKSTTPYLLIKTHESDIDDEIKRKIINKYYKTEKLKDRYDTYYESYYYEDEENLDIFRKERNEYYDSLYNNYDEDEYSEDKIFDNYEEDEDEYDHSIVEDDYDDKDYYYNNYPSEEYNYRNDSIFDESNNLFLNYETDEERLSIDEDERTDNFINSYIEKAEYEKARKKM